MISVELFPTTETALFTVVGAIVFCVLVTQWIKSYLPDWRYTGLLAFGLAALFVEIAGLLMLFTPDGAPVVAYAILRQLLIGLLIAFVAASIATYGYEQVVNLLGAAGVGPRSDKALKVAKRE